MRRGFYSGEDTHSAVNPPISTPGLTNLVPASFPQPRCSLRILHNTQADSHYHLNCQKEKGCQPSPTRSQLCVNIVPVNIISNTCFPGGSDSKESACNVGDPGSIPGSGRSPGREWQPSPVLLPEKFQRQRSLVGTVGLQRAGHD